MLYRCKREMEDAYMPSSGLISWAGEIDRWTTIPIGQETSIKTFMNRYSGMKQKLIM